MKLRVITSILVVMILIISVAFPAFANSIPEPPTPGSGSWNNYWVIYSYDGLFRCVFSIYPITATVDETTDEVKLYFPNGYIEYILADDGWQYYGWAALGQSEFEFDSIYDASHDIAYKDREGFFFSCGVA